jgi:hypothetical protein
MIDWLSGALSALVQETEFWSAIVGAIVGGGISLLAQAIALRAGRKQRFDDYKRIDQALGHSLLFKLMRIHSNFFGVHRHIEECFERARQSGEKYEPWQIYLPLANLADSVHFSSDEMGMLLGQKDDDVFNRVMSIDVVHNSLMDAFKVLNADRRSLASLLRPDNATGNVLSGVFTREEMLRLRPKMIEVNTLIEAVRAQAIEELKKSQQALNGLNELLRNKLDLKIRVQVPKRPA